MKQKTKTIIGIAAFIIFLGGAAFTYNALSKKTASPTKAKSSATKEKTKAPDFTVLDSEEKEVSLSSLIGKPIVLNFWASWCPPCKSEMPEFNKVYKELGDDITFLMVDMVDGQRETAEIGKAYISEQAFTFPVYYDTNQDAAYTYGVASLPTTYFIDKEGYVVTGAQGAISETVLRDSIKLIQK